jgi:hypothetical protein
MSASMCYRKVEHKNFSMKTVGAPSLFMSFLEEAFGCGFPMRLGSDHLSVIRGLSIGAEGMRQSFEELMEIIEKHGEIELWPEY